MIAMKPLGNCATRLRRTSMWRSSRARTKRGRDLATARHAGVLTIAEADKRSLLIGGRCAATLMTKRLQLSSRR
jgi:hypothetical protein